MNGADSVFPAQRWVGRKPRGDRQLAHQLRNFGNIVDDSIRYLKWGLVIFHSNLSLAVSYIQIINRIAVFKRIIKNPTKKRLTYAVKSAVRQKKKTLKLTF